MVQVERTNPLMSFGAEEPPENPPGATVEPWQQLDERRVNVRAIHKKLRERIQAEIETL